MAKTDLEIKRCREYCQEFDKLCSTEDRAMVELQGENDLLKGKVRALEKENTNLKSNLELIQER